MTKTALSLGPEGVGPACTASSLMKTTVGSLRQACKDQMISRQVVVNGCIALEVRREVRCGMALSREQKAVE